MPRRWDKTAPSCCHRLSQFGDQQKWGPGSDSIEMVTVMGIIGFVPPPTPLPHFWQTPQSSGSASTLIQGESTRVKAGRACTGIFQTRAGWRQSPPFSSVMNQQECDSGKCHQPYLLKSGDRKKKLLGLPRESCWHQIPRFPSFLRSFSVSLLCAHVDDLSHSSSPSLSEHQNGLLLACRSLLLNFQELQKPVVKQLELKISLGRSPDSVAIGEFLAQRNSFKHHKSGLLFPPMVKHLPAHHFP